MKSADSSKRSLRRCAESDYPLLAGRSFKWWSARKAPFLLQAVDFHRLGLELGSARKGEFIGYFARRMKEDRERMAEGVSEEGEDFAMDIAACEKAITDLSLPTVFEYEPGIISDASLLSVVQLRGLGDEFWKKAPAELLMSVPITTICRLSFDEIDRCQSFVRVRYDIPSVAKRHSLSDRFRIARLRKASALYTKTYRDPGTGVEYCSEVYVYMGKFLYTGSPSDYTYDFFNRKFGKRIFEVDGAEVGCPGRSFQMSFLSKKAVSEYLSEEYFRGICPTESVSPEDAWNARVMTGKELLMLLNVIRLSPVSLARLPCFKLGINDREGGERVRDRGKRVLYPYRLFVRTVEANRSSYQHIRVIAANGSDEALEKALAARLAKIVAIRDSLVDVGRMDDRVPISDD